MRKILCISALAASALLLAGCAGQMQLLEDGRTHQGSYNQAAGTAQVNIDGVLYTTGDYQTTTYHGAPAE